MEQIAKIVGPERQMALLGEPPVRGPRGGEHARLRRGGLDGLALAGAGCGGFGYTGRLRAPEQGPRGGAARAPITTAYLRPPLSLSPSLLFSGCAGCCGLS